MPQRLYGRYSPAETIIEYRGADIMRDQNTLLIPWIDGTVKIVLPPGVLDFFIVAISGILAIIGARKLRIIDAINKVIYEK